MVGSGENVKCSPSNVGIYQITSVAGGSGGAVGARERCSLALPKNRTICQELSVADWRSKGKNPVVYPEGIIYMGQHFKFVSRCQVRAMQKMSHFKIYEGKPAAGCFGSSQYFNIFFVSWKLINGFENGTACLINLINKRSVDMLENLWTRPTASAQFFLFWNSPEMMPWNNILVSHISVGSI